MKNKFDITEPTIGHFNRFQSKIEKQLQPKKSNRNWYKYIAIAASLLLFISLGVKSTNSNKGLELAEVSPKMKETQDYFATAIHQEIEKINKIKTSKNKRIINDAFTQLQLLEKDYQKQKIALKSNSKNKNVIFAMINNYQHRIEILQNLLNKLNDFNNIKHNYNETNI